MPWMMRAVWSHAGIASVPPSASMAGSDCASDPHPRRGDRHVDRVASDGADAGPDTDGVDAPSPTALTGNAADAMKAIALYEEAFVQEDCDLFAQATTHTFRERIGLVECEAFLSAAQGRAEVVDSLELIPIEAGARGRGAMGALVHAELRSFVDENGGRVETPVSSEAEFRYHLLRADGAWKIDDVHDVTGGRIVGQVTDEDREQAYLTMVEWQKAYSSGDCEALQLSTTPSFRDSMGWADCPSFEQFIIDQNAYCPMDVHQEDIHFYSRVDSHGGEIFVDVVEVCTVSVDELGEPIDPPYQVGSPNRFHLVEAEPIWRISTEDNGAAAEDEPGNGNERAAIEAIRGYNDAWLTDDCDTYMATTTAGFRNEMDLAGCASFGPAARQYAAEVDNFAATPTDIERPSATQMQIKVHETYDSLTDAEGQPVETPFLVDEYWVYTIVLRDGSWVISNVDLLL